MSEFRIMVGEGGDLVTRASADRPGPLHCVVKRDWRREDGQDVRREGDVPFAPKAGGEGTQPFPNTPNVNEAITLQFTARRDDGKTAYICGTPTKLFRYYAFEDPLVLEAGVIEDGIVAAIGGTWALIGAGFAADGNRWEAKNVAGRTVFNNGADLPVEYRLQEFDVRPLYELREQGVAFVGSIEEVDGVLMFGDIAEIHAEYLATALAQVGYGRFTDAAHFDRVHYRVVWGDPIGPHRWAMRVPGAMAAGSRVLTLNYAVRSLAAGDEIRVVGAGEDGADLKTSIEFFASPTRLILKDAAVTGVSDAAVSLLDAATLMVGAQDLLDDSSPILRITKLLDYLVVAKGTGFIIGEFTGTAGRPFTFKRVYTGKDGILFWRWTMIEVHEPGSTYLLYAGDQSFFTFDLVTRKPQPHQRLALCDDLFFKAVATSDQDLVFAAHNALTGEVWFCFPSSTADKALAFDYVNGKVTTIGEAYTSAETVEKPGPGVAHSVVDKWFTMGLASGMLVQYARTRTGSFAWRRRGADYNSDLWPGMADFGNVRNEKHLSQYLLLLASQSPDNQVTVAFYGVRNPGEQMEELPDSPEVFTSPQTRNTSYLNYQVNLIQDRLRATGAGDVRISERVWTGGGFGGGGFTRR